MALQNSPGARKETETAETRRDPARRSAPYISFASLLRVLEALRGSRPHDKAVRRFIEDLDKTRSTHRIAAMRFLGLLDADTMPTPALSHALGTIGTAAWSGTLALTIKNSFYPLLALDLANLALTEFETAFARHYAGSEAVLRKSRTFFVHAAIQAKIPLSPGLARSAKPRAGDRVIETGRNHLRPTVSPGGERRGSSADGMNAVEPLPSLAVRLLAELDTHTMDDDVRQAFWTLLRHIKDQGL